MWLFSVFKIEARRDFSCHDTNNAYQSWIKNVWNWLDPKHLGQFSGTWDFAWQTLIRFGLTESTDKKSATTQLHIRVLASHLLTVAGFVRSILHMQTLNPFRITRPESFAQVKKKIKTVNHLSLSTEHTKSECAREGDYFFVRVASHFQVLRLCMEIARAETCFSIWIYCKPPAHTDATVHRSFLHRWHSSHRERWSSVNSVNILLTAEPINYALHILVAEMCGILLMQILYKLLNTNLNLILYFSPHS